MTFYRIDRPQRATAAQSFSGEGGLFAAGRWNPKGLRVVYCASSLSLACMETLVHIPSPRRLEKRVYFQIEVPDKFLDRVDVAMLPRNWRRHPAHDATRRIGAEWLRKGKRAALMVPSALLPDWSESNLLINPLHADFDLRWVQGPSDFVYDSRLV